jgi:hypothetical protein
MCRRCDFTLLICSSDRLLEMHNSSFIILNNEYSASMGHSVNTT